MKASHVISLFALVGVVSFWQPVLAAAEERPDLFASHKIATAGTLLSDQELASIEGTAACIGCLNIQINPIFQITVPVLTQINTAVLPQINTGVQTVVAVGSNITQTVVSAMANIGTIGQNNQR